MTDNFLTSEQVAASLQVHPYTVLKLIKAKKLPAIKIGRMYRIKEADLNKFIESSAKQSAESVAQKIATPPSKHPPIEEKERKSTGVSKSESGKDHFIINK